MLGRDPIFYTTAADGKFTNVMATGDYDVVFTNRFTATPFRITLPDTNCACLLNAYGLTTAGTNSPSNLNTYSQAAANEQFRITWSTNGGAAITNRAQNVVLGSNLNAQLTTTGIVINASGGGSGDTNTYTGTEAITRSNAPSLFNPTIVGPVNATLNWADSPDAATAKLNSGALVFSVNGSPGIELEELGITFNLPSSFESSLTLSGISGSGSELHIDADGSIKRTNITGGSSFPLTTDANAARFGITNINGLTSTNGKKLIYFDASRDTHFALGAGNSTYSGARNLGIGLTALNSLTSGTDNTAIGEDGVGFSTTTGVGNTFVGSASGVYNTSGSYNTAVGSSALYGNGVSGAGRFLINCTAIGRLTLGVLTNGDYNTAVGGGAARVLVNGRYNTIVGGDALRDGVYVNESVGIGLDALMKSTNSYNTAVGTYALQFVYDGVKNVAIGYNSGTGLLNGTNNTFLGAEQTTVTNGNGNIFIGYGADGLFSANTTNKLGIGNLIFGTGLSAGSTLSSGNVGIRNPTPSNALDIVGNVMVRGNQTNSGGINANGYNLVGAGGSTVSGRIGIWNGTAGGIAELNAATMLNSDFAGNVTASSLTATGQVRCDSLYATGDVSALTFTDRSSTPRDEAEAWAIVNSISWSTNGEVDHAKLHRAAWGKKTIHEPTGRLTTNVAAFETDWFNFEAGPDEDYIAPELAAKIVPDQTKRDLGMVISAHAICIQSLNSKINSLMTTLATVLGGGLLAVGGNAVRKKLPTAPAKPEQPKEG